MQGNDIRLPHQFVEIDLFRSEGRCLGGIKRRVGEQQSIVKGFQELDHAPANARSADDADSAAVVSDRFALHQMCPVAISVGDVEVAETENTLAGEDDRRQREFGHRHGVGLGRMADRDTGFEDGVVDDALYRARGMSPSPAECSLKKRDAASVRFRTFIFL